MILCTYKSTFALARNAIHPATSDSFSHRSNYQNIPLNHPILTLVSTTMSKGTVLITGLNGFIAGVTAKHFLEEGYNVRGTVRRISSANDVVEGPLKSYAQSGALTVVEVPDITVPGAFDEAVKGVTAIAHLASPSTFYLNDPEPIMKAARDGTTTILSSALKAGPQLKTVLYLSSGAALMTSDPAPYTYSDKDWNNWSEAMVDAQGKETPGHIIYFASKAAAEKAFWKFRETNKPTFTQTALNPVFVIGPSLFPPKTAADVNVTNTFIWTIFKGESLASQQEASGLGLTVDVRDVASQVEYAIAHPEETDGERYLTSAYFATAQSTADVLRKAFPDSRNRIDEGTPGKGYASDYSVLEKDKNQDADGSRGRKLLKGGAYIPHDKSLIDAAKGFVHLV